MVKYLVDCFFDFQVYVIFGWEFCDNILYCFDDCCVVIGVFDYGKIEEVIKVLELGWVCGVFIVVFIKCVDSLIILAVEFSIDYQVDCIWEIYLLFCYSVVLEMIICFVLNVEIGKIKNDFKQLLNVFGYLVCIWEEKGCQFGELVSQWLMIYIVVVGLLCLLGYKEGIVMLMEFIWMYGCVIESGEFCYGLLEIVELGVLFLFLFGNDESCYIIECVINFVKQCIDNVIVIDYVEIL